MKETDMPRLALIVGVTGGLASEVAKALLLHGWSVRGLSREPERAKVGFPELAAIDWRAGDAMRAADVRRAAEGAALILHGANPSRYRNWRGLAIPMLANSINAAKGVGARIVLPGNLYNFGLNATQLLREDTPQQPSTRKGRIRVEMEEMLHDARSLVVRAGDFFGPHAPGSWMSNAVVKPGRALRSIVDPGSNGVGHAWAYLPDLAETIARLADNDDKLAAHDVIHFRGHWLEDSREMMEAIRRAAGNPKLQIKRFPWWAIALTAPVVRLSREVAEMRYLWQYPFALDNTKLVNLIGAEPHTPLDAAVALTLQRLGCLPTQADQKSELLDSASLCPQ
jgi:nucleoside-diphosphate-sugar epimerase